MTPLCCFATCTSPVEPSHIKCAAHRHREMCHVSNCTNQVYARNLCVRHGGRNKCSVKGCTSNARMHGVCCKHGATSKKHPCEVLNCPRLAHARRKCVAHGGRQKCRIEGCQAYAHQDGDCQRHIAEVVNIESTNPAPIFIPNSNLWLYLCDMDSIDIQTTPVIPDYEWDQSMLQCLMDATSMNTNMVDMMEVISL